MKDKPFGLQIWVTMTGFLVFITIIITLVLVNYLSIDLLGNLIRFLVILSIVNICIAKIISNKITEPLRYLEKRVKKIANKEWGEPITLDRGDEFGKLAASINMMQESLKKMEVEEEIFLQSVSHDLKTPIMVIRSYAQALQDKVYLHNSFEGTVSVIIKEAANLESKVEKLLYLNSLDYIFLKKNEFKKINLNHMLESLNVRFSLNQQRIKIKMEWLDIEFWGNEEELMVAFENILENNVRYAATTIWIVAHTVKYEGVDCIKISFKNDGPPIEDNTLEQLFNHFHKGKSGKFGLGLFITKKIIDFHNGDIQVKNTDSGVIFNVFIPLQ
ncbi:sensor histidine kinase [Pseudobacillus wudalianchiensis]|uniref:histidine kinase n=1 Tax=Pseudobacillus wudalianchiensis TaxID=1743143 RepID=A0A1B9AYX3_9BACI|nr:HAMP domain-containing sensor histidine kinase [Bacillus wudalianchiensis]OCA88938.1 histidine kinase [Bacillus wudalianchiensis]